MSTISKMVILINNKSYRAHPVYDLYAASEDGTVIHVVRKVPLRGNEKHNGYVHVIVRSQGSTSQVTMLVHRFVYECYRGLIPKSLVIDHRNDVRDDNRLENLSIMTTKENNLKAAKNRDFSNVVKNFENRKCVKAINQNSDEVLFFRSMSAAGKRLGVNHGTISKICRGEPYRKTGISKVDGDNYSFRFVSEEEFAKVSL